MLFVAAHEFGDAATVLLCQHQQIGAAVERVREHRGVGCDHLLFAAVVRDLVADDEAAADRVSDARQHLGAIGIEGGKAHAVGVEGQGLTAVEDEVGSLGECDPLHAQQRYRLRLTYAF